MLTAACASPSSALSITASTVPDSTVSPSNLSTRLTNPFKRVPTAATCSGLNATVPTAATTGTSSERDTGANLSLARSTNAREKVMRSPSTRGVSGASSGVLAAALAAERPRQTQPTIPSSTRPAPSASQRFLLRDQPAGAAETEGADTGGGVGFDTSVLMAALP